MAVLKKKIDGILIHNFVLLIDYRVNQTITPSCGVFINECSRKIYLFEERESYPVTSNSSICFLHP